MAVLRTLGTGCSQAKAWPRNFSKLQNSRAFGHLRCAIRRLPDWPKVGPPNKFIDSPSSLGKNGLSCFRFGSKVFLPDQRKGLYGRRNQRLQNIVLGKDIRRELLS